MFIELTPNAEKLLQDILDKQLENGNSDTEYWENRFGNLNYANRMQLKSTFKELQDEEMIKVQWADSFPYLIVVLNNGISYFELKDRHEKEVTNSIRSKRLHDISMVALGALLTGFVGIVLYFCFGIGG